MPKVGGKAALCFDCFLARISKPYIEALRSFRISALIGGICTDIRRLLSAVLKQCNRVNYSECIVVNASQ